MEKPPSANRRQIPRSSLLNETMEPPPLELTAPVLVESHPKKSPKRKVL